MTVPPSYSADVAPPSYDEVAQKLDDMVGSDPTPDKVFEAAGQLSEEEINVLVDGVDSHWPLETEAQKEEFTIGAGQTLSSDEGKVRLQSTAMTVTQATKEIDDVFFNLETKLAQIDAIHKSNFQPEISNLKETYQKILADSRDLAARMSVQVETFDDMIVPLCAESSISVDVRTQQLNIFLQNSASSGENATAIQGRFTDLSTSFERFVGTFSDWAKDKEGEITEQIKVVSQELDDLNKTLSALNASLAVFENIAEYSLPVTGGLSVLMPQFAPFFLIGGLISVGLSVATIAGLSIAKSITEGKIITKTREKENLEAQLEQIRQTRAELEDLGNASLVRFADAIAILTGSWGSTAEDAQRIRVWLGEGAVEAKQPEYMRLNLRYNVKKYDAISEYLEYYARGITA
ncbi:hypothetical protein BO71DRAFT_442457 [Aspergillus ellipticus CBS 707.79]|uniref:Uncharacterized protein n=1 Tax=Aspergillus ellipticus CBS 707.79 TaxID=1448320 RepID=A0A319EN72_9EURO|nr:hypothetical protein BO71DRAFT_442457 [Aspergillus ellipticus CBS 707.79]